MLRLNVFFVCVTIKRCIIMKNVAIDSWCANQKFVNLERPYREKISHACARLGAFSFISTLAAMKPLTELSFGLAIA